MAWTKPEIIIIAGIFVLLFLGFVILPIMAERMVQIQPLMAPEAETAIREVVDVGSVPSAPWPPMVVPIRAHSADPSVALARCLYDKLEEIDPRGGPEWDQLSDEDRETLRACVRQFILIRRMS